MKVQLSISSKFARNVALFLCVVVASFVFLSLISEALNTLVWVSGVEDGDLDLFSLDDESLPAWYSSSILFVCAMLLSLITVAATGDRYKSNWAVLSAIFFFLSADESAQIHDRAGRFLGSIVNGGSFSSGYIWVVLYAPFVLVFALLYLRFLRDLPTKIRRLFFAAGFLYVGGALGMEIVDGFYANFYGQSSLGGFLLRQVEETLEMLGVVVFLYALLLYMGLYVREVSLRPE